jgi:hypothetical protein
MGGLRPRWHNSEEIFETNADDPYWRITESFLILAWPQIGCRQWRPVHSSVDGHQGRRNHEC